MRTHWRVRGGSRSPKPFAGSTLSRVLQLGQRRNTEPQRKVSSHCCFTSRSRPTRESLSTSCDPRVGNRLCSSRSRVRMRRLVRSWSCFSLSSSIPGQYRQSNPARVRYLPSRPSIASATKRGGRFKTTEPPRKLLSCRFTTVATRRLLDGKPLHG